MTSKRTIVRLLVAAIRISPFPFVADTLADMRYAFLAFLAGWTAGAQPLPFRSNDVVAFVGGSDVAAAQHTGHLEALLSIQYRSLNLRFRNFGWEGDTVFSQPRDFAFPPLEKHLERAGVTVIVFQFGRAEALEGRASSEFGVAYSNFLARFTNQTSRFLLVNPPSFERASGLVPDLTMRNSLLADYARAIRRMGFPVVDLSRVSGITEDGLQITPRGHGLLAAEFARQLGFKAPPQPSASGAWENSSFEKVRQTIIAKNRLWFDYWRPQNWAFLGGDRTSVASSRDHRDPKVRWFPAEMEKFLPLIAEQEEQIRSYARASLPN
jgi:hypothetical protein